MIYSNYPNPSSDLVNILYYLPEDAHIDILIYDILGREIEQIESAYKSEGYYTLDWNSKNHSSGEYFIRLSSGETNDTKKVVLIK